LSPILTVSRRILNKQPEESIVSHSDKSFFSNLIIVIGALVVFMILAMILANSLPTGTEDKNKDPMVQSALRQWVQLIPVP
jgi:hypothetical protein